MNLNSIVQQLQAERQAQANGVSAKAVSGKAAAAAPSGTPGDAGDTTITADDFLTLLITELKNQDPTSDTDPNAYVNQLVDVNSLQQLIQINSGIGSLNSSVDAPAPTSGNGPSANAVHGAVSASAPAAPVTQAQVNSAQASYNSFEPAIAAFGGVSDQMNVAQQLDPTNPALNTQNANANPGVPSMWRSGQAVTS